MVRGGDKKGRPEYVSCCQVLQSEVAITGVILFRSVCKKLMDFLVNRRKMFDLEPGML